MAELREGGSRRDTRTHQPKTGCDEKTPKFRCAGPALCVRLGKNLPGRPTIPEQLTRNRILYYAALADADVAWRESSVVDVGKLEGLLEDCLENQLNYLDIPDP